MNDSYHGFKLRNFVVDGMSCKIVEPNQVLTGKKWVWKAEFFEAFPKFELEMLKRGYYLCYMNVGNTFGCPSAMRHFDKFYEALVFGEGFNPKPIMLGLSRGGLYIYNWAAKNPDKVKCLYADNPVCDFKSWPGGIGTGPGSPEDWAKLINDYGFLDEQAALAYQLNPVDNLTILAQYDVPLIHAVGMQDEVVPVAENTDIIEERYQKLGGTIKVFRHDGLHHPHGLEDPTELIEYLIHLK